MLNLIPKVKNIENNGGNFKYKSVYFEKNQYSEKLRFALDKLPYDVSGAKLEISVIGTDSEEYELIINDNQIKITAESEAAAFYAVCTNWGSSHKVRCFFTCFLLCNNLK